MNYFINSDIKMQNALAKVKPFWVRMAFGVTYDALMKRCSVEYDSCCNGDNRLKKFPKIRLLIDFTITQNFKLFEVTISSWIFQSLQSKDCLILCSKEQHDDVRDYIKNNVPFSCLNNFTIKTKLAFTSSADISSFIVLANPGDIYHPSFAYSLSLMALESKAKVITWNSYGYFIDKIITKIYRPNLQPLTLLNNDYLDSAFAVCSAELFKYIQFKKIKNTPELLGLSFKHWLAGSLKDHWVSLSEFLSMQLIDNQKKQGTVKSALYNNYLSKITKLPLEIRNENKNCFLIPSGTAKSITVIIPFRNEADRTLKCVYSVLMQKSDAFIDIILINNQSEQKELIRITRKLHREIKKKKVMIFDYPYAFNHSRQSNIGASLAKGEMIVFLNNDAELIEPDLLDVLTRFALLENVATIGCRIVDKLGKLSSSGIVTRIKTLTQIDSPVEESKEEKLSNLIREVTANTFAIVAISKKRFRAIGCLDERFYPIGFNDVEFCLRAHNAGYKHLYVGIRNVLHEPGTSRGKYDESFQKLMLRQKYPWVSNQVFNEWKIEEVVDNIKILTAKRELSIIHMLNNFSKYIKLGLQNFSNFKEFK